MAPEVRPPLLVIVGETASGKSDLALRVAEKHNGEIICADSWTVYKGFNIGTSKPSWEERRRIPHHLLDVTTASRGFSAPRFKRLAENAILDISNRGKLPIMVGGAGLYIDSVLFDYSFLPKSSKSEREQLNAMSLSALLDLAHQRNLPIEQVDIRNKRRVIRLIENNGQLPDRSELRSNTQILGLSLSREELAERITKRVDHMLDAGLEAEVDNLASQYGWDCEPMKGVGYREWREYFDNIQSIEKTKDRIIQATLRLAKKQRTWFKRKIYNNRIQWLSNSGEVAGIDETITTLLNKLY